MRSLLPNDDQRQLVAAVIEAVGMGLGDGRHEVCRTYGGKHKRRKVKHTETAVRSGSAGSWRNNFIKATLVGLKSTLDPNWVLNPGILLEEKSE